VTTGAWIMLLVTWTAVAGVSLYLVMKVLTTPPRSDD
jgi:hypothetical protein